MNITAIRTAVQSFIVDNTTLDDSKVIRANQNSPRPNLSYITYLVTPTRKSEHANIGSPNDDGDALIENEKSITVSVQCFGEDAFDILEGLRGSLDKVTVRDALRAAGIPYIRTLNGVNDLTETVGTKFEGRAGIDLEFRTVDTVTDAVGVIESVEGTATHEISSNENYENTFQIGE